MKNQLDIHNAKIAIIGLGYVGLPLAVEFGKQRDVIGFDINTKRISDLRAGHDFTLEVNKEELEAAKNLKFSNNLEDIRECTVYIVTVPTPIDSVNRPNLDPLLKSSKTVGSVLSKGDIVIYESTVFPGCTEEFCVPILEKESNLRYNEDFYCGYSPERINPGDKENTLTKIKKVTSGSTPEIGEYIDALYSSIIEAGTFLAQSIKVAEAAKVIENTQRDINIALVNELSVIFAKLNIDTLDVLEAAGTKWNFLPFRPGLVGGHCIGVDPYYLTHKAEEVGYNPQVILAGRRINNNMGSYSAQTTIKLMSQNGIDIPNSRVAVLGVTFKENCPDIRNSKVIDVINELKDWGVEVVVSDAWADKEEVYDEYKFALTDFADVKDVDAVIVAVNHKEYANLPIDEFRKICRAKEPVFSDLKSAFDRRSLKEAGFTIFRL